MIKKFNETSIIVDDDIKLIGVEKLNGSPVMRMNINSSMVGSLASELQNIHNTLKDVPDMKSKQLDIHGYSDRFGNEPTLKEDVYSALMRVREMEDIVRPLSHKYFFPNGEDDYSDEHKAIVEIVKKKYREDITGHSFEIIKKVDEIENNLLTRESKERLKKELN